MTLPAEIWPAHSESGNCAEVWRKSSHSQINGNCTEVALDHDTVQVRDSKDPDGPRLSFTKGEWNAFLNVAKQEG